MAMPLDSRAALETYLDFLDTSSTDTENLKVHHPTPRIDSVLQHYWQRQQTCSDATLSPSVSDALPPSASPPCALADQTSYESRLKQLEQQLSDLLHRSKVHASPRRHTAKRKDSQRYRGSTDDSEHSGSDAPPTLTATNQPVKASSRPHPSSRLHPSSKPHPSGKPLPSQGTAGKTEGHSHVTSSLHKRAKTKSSQLKSKTSRAEGSTRTKADDTSRRADHRPIAGDSPSSPHPAPQLHSPAEDRSEKTRLLLEAHRKGRGQEDRTNEATLQVLTRERDSEREQRWKAEQAAGRLIEHVRTLQTRITDTQRGQERIVAMAAKLEAELASERSTVQSLKDKLKQLEEALSSSREETGRLHRSGEEQVCALRAMEEEGRKREAQVVQERTRMADQLRESEQTASGHAREAELLRRSVQQLEQQVRQTQEVLATRERDHQTELARCRPPGSREVEEAVGREVERERTRAAALQEEQGRRLAEQQEAYHRLEGEFREALRIEAARFQQLQQSYDEVCSEVDASRQTAVAAVQREQRATAMVTELTAMVKEQKGRITELSRSKQESMEVWQRRVRELEGEAATWSKVEVRLQTLQEENSKLSAQVTAQESVIAGLREERQLWGKELAHQGATLAQDRGRMEAQVEALLQEVKGLHQQTERDRDNLRIKEKMLEDQNETLHQLRQALASKEHELRSQQLSWQQEQQMLELHLEQEEAAGQDLQEQLSAMAERKEQLKEEIASAQEEVDQWKNKYSKLKAQWSDKVAAIDSLEHSLKQLQESYSEKEATLVMERNEALGKARTAEGRLKSCDDTFREQLEAKQKSHDSHVTKLLEQKDGELHAANQRVLAVEAEMRKLLSEVAREKQGMEAKFQRLSRAFQELQQDMS